MVRSSVSGRASISVAQNLIKYSEEFDNAVWTKQAGVSITQNSATDPLNGTTADLVDLTSAGAGQGVYQVSTATNFNGLTVTLSVWLRMVTGTGQVRLKEPVNSPDYLDCNLTTSWQRFSLTIRNISAPNVGLWIAKISGNQIYAWGAQITLGSYQANYVKTTAAAVNAGTPRKLESNLQTLPTIQNLAYWTEDFTQAFWAKTRVTCPNPTEIVETNTTGFHLVEQAYSVPGNLITLSVEAKAGLRNSVGLNHSIYGAAFDLVNGVVLYEQEDANGSVTSQITPAADGYYKCTVNITISSDPGFMYFQIYVLNSGVASYLGSNAAVAIYLRKASAINTNWLPEYVQNTASPAFTSRLRRVP